MAIQTDSENQKQERDSCMKCACVLAVPTMCVSFIAFVVGAFAITKSQPVYAFPYCIGGAMIAGIFTCVSSFVQYRHYNIYSNNKDDVTKEHAQQWSRQLCILCPFVCIALILGLAFSGIWGMVQATAEKRDHNNEILARTNLQYAIASFVLVLTLFVLQMILYCVCHGFKATYSFDHQVQGHDEFYIPANSYTYRPRFRHEVTTGETRINYSNAAHRNQQSVVDSHASSNLSRLSARGPYVTDQSEINSRQLRAHGLNNPLQQRDAAYSIPIPELYYGRGMEATAPPSETTPTIRPTAPPSERTPTTGNEANVDPYMHRNRPHTLSVCESPPRYEEFADTGLPTYQEVIETGAYYIVNV